MEGFVGIVSRIRFDIQAALVPNGPFGPRLYMMWAITK